VCWPETVRAQESPVVHAVLFHSPTCGHCRIVIEEVLPSLQEKYGGQLDILMLDTSLARNGDAFQSAFEMLRPEADSRGVPALAVGDRLLVGSVEIPEQFPGLIEAGLAAGGIDLPSIPGLRAEGGPGDEPGGTLSGMGVGWLVLIGLIASLLYCGHRIWSSPGFNSLWAGEDPPGASGAGRSWAVVALALVGLVIAGYLTSVEVGDVPLTCGPVGDCETVQNSDYVHLLGLPMGLWGVIAFATVLGLWCAGVRGAVSLARYARPALLFLVLFCVAFSAFLTVLELFVIKAVCSWCMGSAVVTATLCWVLTLDGAWLPMESSIRRPRRRRKAGRRPA
jgi:uncharacterized membrane protein/thiol-disulfide isomerase/thioredoxin